MFPMELLGAAIGCLRVILVAIVDSVNTELVSMGPFSRSLLPQAKKYLKCDSLHNPPTMGYNRCAGELTVNGSHTAHRGVAQPG